MFDPYSLRKDFPMLNGKAMQGQPLVFLDNSSTTLKPYKVIEAIDDYYNNSTSNSHRGDYDLCAAMDKKIEETRKAVASFINSEQKEIVFTTGTTESLNMIAKSFAGKYLNEGDEIILSEAEHASNLLPWFEVAKEKNLSIIFAPLENGRVTVESVLKIISPKTKLISLAHVTNVLGYELDVKRLCKEAHQRNILVSIDGAQSVPHLKTDVKDLDCDFLSFSAHKMCGPTGVGVLYAKYDLLQKMDVFKTGGGMNVKFYKDTTAIYLDAPMKFEAGTLNLAGICGLLATINYLNSVGMENIHKYEIELRKYAISELMKLDNIIIYNEDATSGIIAFNIKDVFAQDAATYLNSKGVACRSGQHCAKILNPVINTIATIRASFYFYNTKEDIDALVKAVKEGGNYLDAYFI